MKVNNPNPTPDKILDYITEKQLYKEINRIISILESIGYNNKVRPSQFIKSLDGKQSIQLFLEIKKLNPI